MLDANLAGILDAFSAVQGYPDRLLRKRWMTMTIITLDAETLAKLQIPNDLVAIANSSGETVGFFQPLTTSEELRGSPTRSPFSDEEIERRRQQRTGCSLAEILEGLE